MAALSSKTLWLPLGFHPCSWPCTSHRPTVILDIVKFSTFFKYGFLFPPSVLIRPSWKCFVPLVLEGERCLCVSDQQQAVFQSHFASSQLMAPEDVCGPLGHILALQHSSAMKPSQCVSLSGRGNVRLALLWACLLPWSPSGWDAGLRGSEMPQTNLKDRMVLS